MSQISKERGVSKAMGFPRILWNEDKLLENAHKLDTFCAAIGIDWIPVTKSVCANSEIITSLSEHGYMSLADSRIENVKSIKQCNASISTYLLRLPGIHEIEDVINWADYSLVSEWVTIKALDQEASKQIKKHGVILMIELGDLREGILPQELIQMGEKILQLSSIEWIGIGTNLTCYGGVIPTKEILTELLTLKQLVTDRLGHTLSVISGGNSSSLPLVLNNEIPKGVNQLRLGESLFFGKETAYGKHIEGMHNDLFILEAEVIELMHKPSYPKGLIGMNAFGEKPVFEDKGIRRRAIVAIGEQDVPASGLVPIQQGIDIVGASSDHLILDTTDYNGDIKVGTICTFRLNYKALLHAMTSKYVTKEKV